MELIEIAKTKIAERTNGKAPSHLFRAASVVWSRVESWSEEDAQAKLRMLPPKSGYMLFLLAIALIFMSLFQNGFFQDIETVVAVYSYLRLVWRCLRSHCGRYERPIGETHGSNQSMNPTAHREMRSVCLPRHRAVAYLRLFR